MEDLSVLPCIFTMYVHTMHTCTSIFCIHLSLTYSINSLMTTTTEAQTTTTQCKLPYYT